MPSPHRSASDSDSLERADQSGGMPLFIGGRGRSAAAWFAPPEVSGPRSERQRANLPYAASVRDAILVVRAAILSTLGAEESSGVATRDLAIVNGPASYLEWSWLSISVPNLIVILVMILLFVLAIALPFPKDRHPR